MMFWKLDQKLSERSTVLYQTVIDDGKKLDRLHVEVLAVKKRMGKKPDCGVEEGKCVSCARTKKAVEREAKEKEAEEKAAKETEAKANKKGNKRTGTGSKTKWGLENIVEEDDMNDWANLQF